MEKSEDCCFLICISEPKTIFLYQFLSLGLGIAMGIILICLGITLYFVDLEPYEPKPLTKKVLKSSNNFFSINVVAGKHTPSQPTIKI